MIKKIAIACVLVVTATLTQAQTNYVYLAWDYNMPLSNKEWLDSSTPHGGVLGYRHFIRDGQLSVGVDINWTTYDQYEPRQTFQQTNGALTTDYYKYIYQYGGVASVQYYHSLFDGIVLPYYGIGVGANYNQFTLYYNIYEDADKAWGFLVRPEVGAVVKFGKYRSLGAILAAHYDYSTVKYPDYNYSGFSSLGWKLGIVLMGGN